MQGVCWAQGMWEVQNDILKVYEHYLIISVWSLFYSYCHLSSLGPCCLNYHNFFLLVFIFSVCLHLTRCTRWQSKGKLISLDWRLHMIQTSTQYLKALRVCICKYLPRQSSVACHVYFLTKWSLHQPITQSVKCLSSLRGRRQQVGLVLF